MFNVRLNVLVKLKTRYIHNIIVARKYYIVVP
jgi:hypothetical protein